MKRLLKRWYYSLQTAFNYAMDRTVDYADLLLMDVYRWPLCPRWLTHRLVRWLGDACVLLKDFPRVSVYKLNSDKWRIIFVGTAEGVKEMEQLFQMETPPQEATRVPLWKLSKSTRRWLAEGVDLVICELSPLQTYTPATTVHISVPFWINQAITLTDELETLIAGKKFATKRKEIHRAQRAGISYRFSQEKEDFDQFYYQMYLPYVQSRHHDLALVASYADQWTRWFSKGGLIVMTHDDKPVAGVLGYVTNGTAQAVESGVAPTAPKLLQQSTNTLIIWHVLLWAQAQGAQRVNLGGSHGWQSNGAFITKRRWGAQVVRRQKTYRRLHFAAQTLSAAQIDCINQIGFISESGNKFYNVHLTHPPTPTDELTAHAREQGLTGTLIISPQDGTNVYC